MCFIKGCVIICALFILTEGTKLAKYFNPCKRNDPDLNTCIKQQAIAGLSEFIKGDLEHHVIKMTPLHIPEMLFDVDGALNIKLTEADLLGLESAEIRKTNWDFEKKRFELHLKLDRSILLGTYDMKGKILVLPISGSGLCNITFVNPIYKVHIDYDIQQKKNKDYVNVVNCGLSYTVDRAYFDFQNLFNGDKRLGDEMNKFMNENWKEVNEEFRTQAGDVPCKVIGAVLKNFFDFVPMKDLFA